ncbi:MAG: peptidoglycan -binding protein [Rhodospirillaceae bacterium]|nr:chemotaxis protein [Rhodospirillaceae bacterium]RPF99292.1 MAG: peptidoglycan -binding protein [Rhodospirillaceae bacterium TMED63]RZO37073.1 MAG: peptidoglycan -binding protein [Rhodospirillaceae bacterium]
MPGAKRRQRQTFDIWPGFVDALSALLIIIIFLLMVFTLAQFFLGEILSGRNQALERLNGQVAELSEMLSLERSTNARLREDVSRLTTDLQASTAAREQLSGQLAELLPQRDALETELAAARKTISADKEKIEIQLAEIALINRDIKALQDVRAELEKKVLELAATVAERDKSITSLRDQSKELEAKLAGEQERTALAQKEIVKKDLTIRELSDQAERIGDDLTKEQRASQDSRKQVEILNRQLTALRQQLARLNAALEASEAKAAAQNVQIVNLGKRLNEALASKVQELARYRSEFFGRLREAVGNRSGIRIVGDRFVFQSEVLFSSGSASLNPGGQAQIGKLAAALKEIAARIPSDLNWVLRVDGHTDRRPIRTAQFPSNWELSSARATAVVKDLIARGVPAQRLVAAGFGEFQPLDSRGDEVAYRRNRRIEFKLTQR